MRKFLARYAFIALWLMTANPALAQSAQQASRPFAPSSCGPVDPSYIRVAENTGGIPLFFQRSEIAQSTKLMMANSTENHVTLLWANGESENDSTEFLVPVDSTLEQIIFTFSTDKAESKMEVFGPADELVTKDSQADSSDFTCGRYIIVKKPLPGTYRIRVHSSGRFWLSVAGKSEIFLHGVQFVEPGGRPGHEGMFPISGQPLSGRPAHLEASVAGEVKRVSFTLVTPENRPIRAVDLMAVENQADDPDFAGRFPLPSGPFRLLVTGTDQKGVPFQRVHERLFRPTTISLVLVKEPANSGGLTSVLTFQVTNLGNADKFRLRAVCAKSWPVQVDPANLSLGRGQTAKVVVTAAVPEGTPAYSEADLVLTATSESDPSTTNGVVHRLSIDPPQK